MDKTLTPKDDLYGEEKHSRYYLKPIKINGLTLDPTWTQFMGFTETQAYQEKSENINVTVNLENMVQKNREIKKVSVTVLTISYGNTGTVTCLNKNGTLIVKRNGSAIATADLSNYTTTNLLFTYLNSIPGIIITKTGDNSPSNKLSQFNETSFTGGKLDIVVRDTTYDNCSEVFEKGDLILTPSNYLFEVDTNITTGDFGWNYSTFTMSCSRVSIENITLPEGYIQKVYRQDGKIERIGIDGREKLVK